MSFANLAPYLKDNIWIVITLLSIGGLFKFWQYVDLRRREERNRRFENYHELIKSLTQPDSPDLGIRIDRQIASVYELRNFPEYRDVTIRVLNGWRSGWTAEQKTYDRLDKEMELTIGFLSKGLLARKWGKEIKKLGRPRIDS